MRHVFCSRCITSSAINGRAILLRELATIYAAFAKGKPSPLPPLPIQYADFCTLATQGVGSRNPAG